MMLKTFLAMMMDFKENLLLNIKKGGKKNENFPQLSIFYYWLFFNQFKLRPFSIRPTVKKIFLSKDLSTDSVDKKNHFVTI